MGARGLLMLRPIPTFFMEALDTPDTSDTMAMDSDTMARGLLMLRLSLILTTSPTVMVTDLDTPDTSDMPDTLDTDTSTARDLLMLSLRPRLILTTDTDLDTLDMLD